MQLTEEERRGGRACGTCWWFAPRTEEQKARFVSWGGFCHWRNPPTVQGVGPNNTGKHVTDWCSCWEPNLATM